jgi:hypothetical protein
VAKVLIGVPMAGGNISAHTAHSIITPIASRNHDITFNLVGLSLLARNFNTLFLSAHHSGCDYFVLHHADLGFNVDPNNYSGSWIDVLIERVKQLKAAAMSVVSPIKSPAGHTSTGLILDRNNVYKLRRITVRELDKLPTPFISRKHVCDLFNVSPKKAGALLINTGGLIMDLKNFDWTKWPGFCIYDSIAWNKKKRGRVYTRPEDWEMSNWMFENDFPYYATKELAAHHVGAHDYTNFGGWGNPFDDQEREPSIEEWESGDREQ